MDYGVYYMKKQPTPKKNKNKHIADLVISDIKARKKAGKKKYGVELQAFNNRNSAQDAYEEQCDKILYMKQWLIEREEIIKVLKMYANNQYTDIFMHTPERTKAGKLLLKLGEKL